MSEYTLHHGDCLDVLRTMADNSVDSVVSDPPYGLSQHKPDEVIECLRAWLAGEIYKPKGKGFMGKKWDAWVPGPEVWRECLRVLKPGGHILCFAGTRSMDLMCMAIRLAGFELRDAVGYAHDGGGAPLLSWCYGSGFPKSHNLSKAIDREAGARGHDGVGFNVAGIGVSNGGSKFRSDHPEYVKPCGATEAAKQWEGWGSALKPAWEPVILARKPLDGTLASNVLAWGAGGLNIDGCRIGEFQNTTPSGVDRRNAKLAEMGYRPGEYQMGEKTPDTPAGRWPANLIHDGSAEVLAGFPHTASGLPGVKRGGNTGAAYGAESRQPGTQMTGFGDSGSAARFFYTAKASAEDRDAGLHGFEQAKTNGGRKVDADNAYQRGATLRSNTHPTVKPVDLMRYLVRLVTPPGGTVLDPFNGSGSTGKAAILEGFSYIGCEREAQYIEISRARIEHAIAMRKAGSMVLKPAADRDPHTVDLFGVAA
jgi:site-specific DNA-methyltransferase (adenine-specific)